MRVWGAQRGSLTCDPCVQSEILVMQLCQWVNSSVPPSRDRRTHSPGCGEDGCAGIGPLNSVLSALSLQQAVAPSAAPNLLCVWNMFAVVLERPAANATGQALALVPGIISLQGAFCLCHYCWNVCSRARRQRPEQQVQKRPLVQRRKMTCAAAFRSFWCLSSGEHKKTIWAHR